MPCIRAVAITSPSQPILSAAGILLLFTWLVDSLHRLQLSTILHVAGMIAPISVALRHIDIGSVGIEGAIDGILKGEVEKNWAKEHHGIWYELLKDEPEHMKGATG